MTSMNWRVIGGLIAIVLLMSWLRVPSSALMLAVGGLGAYLLWRGAQRWTGGLGSAPRVTYWRGRRIELEPARRRDNETIVTLVAGVALLLIAVMALV